MEWNQRTAAPRSPVPWKYSALPRKCTCRRHASGMTIESMKDRWFEAMMSGPVAGTCSRPSTLSRVPTFTAGPMSTWRSTALLTVPPLTGSLPPGGQSVHSHSMVPGGLLVTSRTTRLTSRTSLVIRVEILASTS